MRPEPTRQTPSFGKQDIAASALVVIYIALMLLLVLAWNYLSDKADAFVGEAKQIDSQELVDIVRVPQPPIGGQSEEMTFGAQPATARTSAVNSAFGALHR